MLDKMDGGIGGWMNKWDGWSANLDEYRTNKGSKPPLREQCPSSVRIVTSVLIVGM